MPVSSADVYTAFQSSPEVMQNTVMNADQKSSKCVRGGGALAKQLVVARDEHRPQNHVSYTLASPHNVACSGS